MKRSPGEGAGREGGWVTHSKKRGGHDAPLRIKRRSARYRRRAGRGEAVFPVPPLGRVALLLRRAVHALICVRRGSRSHAPHTQRCDMRAREGTHPSTLSHNDQLQGARARAGAWLTLEERHVVRGEERGQSGRLRLAAPTPSSAQAHLQSGSRRPYTPRATLSPCSSPPTRNGGAAAEPVITFAPLPWHVGALRGARSCALRTRALAPPRLSER
jgi:hypothetical protein